MFSDAWSYSQMIEKVRFLGLRKHLLGIDIIIFDGIVNGERWWMSRYADMDGEDLWNEAWGYFKIKEKEEASSSSLR